MTPFFLGCHLSSSKGFAAMGETALAIDANTFQFFTRNPRGTSAKAVDPEDAARLAAMLRERAFGPLIAHAPYILNPASKDAHLRDLARDLVADDLARMEYLPGNYYNFHPGSHTGQGLDTGVAHIASMLDAVVPPDARTMVLLETMAGKGSEIGGAFEELRMIIDAASCGPVLGVCLDTCHVWDAGYDVRDDLDGVLARFDAVIGLKQLKAVHLNDSLNPCGAKKDRHAKIGEGAIGLEAITRIVNHEALRHLPFCLETPNDLDGYAGEIRMLRSAHKE